MGLFLVVAFTVIVSQLLFAVIARGVVWTAEMGGGQGQIAPRPQGPRGLATPNASKPKGPHEVN